MFRIAEAFKPDFKVSPEPTGSVYTVSLSRLSPTNKFWAQLEDDEDDNYESIRSILARNTPEARRRELLRLIALLLVPIGSLLILSGLLVSRSVNVLDTVNQGISAIDNDLMFAQVVVNLQVERGMTAMYLSSKGQNREAHKTLQERRLQSDDSIDKLMTWAANGIDVQEHHLRSKVDLLTFLNGHRWSVDITAATMRIDYNIHVYTNVTHALMNWLRSAINLPTQFDVWRFMFHNSMFLLSTDTLGIQRALGSTFATKCLLDEEELEWFTLLGAQSSSLETLAFDICTSCRNIYDSLRKKETEVLQRLDEDTSNFNSEQWQLTCSRQEPSTRFTFSQSWFDDVTVKIADIMVVTRLHHNDLTTQSLHSNAVTARVTVIVFILVILVESMSLFGLAVWFTFNLQKLIDQMKNFLQLSVKMTRDIQGEKDKSEKILLQLLPHQVVEAFKNGLEVESENYNSVTLLFTDIVNFTLYCAQTAPMDVVTLLNEMFSAFDAEIDKRDAFKLETIGDAYTVCSGLPVKNAMRHVTEIARLALDFRTVMTRFQVPNRPLQIVEIRLGVHTGSCCAGVVGIKMPRYCAFGDSLRIANLMESTSQTMRIQMSSESYDLLAEVCDDFDISRRDDGVVIAGYPSPTYWLNNVLMLAERVSRLNSQQQLLTVANVASATSSVVSFN